MDLAATQQLYYIPELKNIYEPKYFATCEDFKYDGLIGVSKSKSINSPISKEVFNSLLDDSSQCLVGVGDETLYKPEVRKCQQIIEFVLEEKFLDYIKETFQSTVKKLEHPCRTDIVFSKMLLYRAEDFFDTHIDAIHQDGMIGTLSVSIPVEGGNETYFDINNTSITDPFVVFYHDAEHSIHVKEGLRLVLTFDVISQNELVPPPYYNEYKAKLLEMYPNIHKLGYIFNHIYIGTEYPSKENLKGIDRVVYELFSELTKESKDSIDVIQFYYDENNKIYHEKFHDLLMTIGNNFYREIEDENDDEDRIFTSEKLSHTVTNLKSYPEKTDTNSIINPRYCLSDAVILASKVKSKHRFTGDDEVFLGNEGFYGEIYSTCGILISK